MPTPSAYDRTGAMAGGGDGIPRPDVDTSCSWLDLDRDTIHDTSLDGGSSTIRLEEAGAVILLYEPAGNSFTGDPNGAGSAPAPRIPGAQPKTRASAASQAPRAPGVGS
ncbi:hypothetical protein M3T53_06830 [Actinomyces sp. B33]|uniref:hypothetical protein n=1 Tax=Actinomyces sp. B33 TaxID=2942131 RepID=UPI0023400E3B|nr:hypothetical protein [Actinomyces sp. B33]MDC4233424.1 hypothetical protein [Actinomyces sp. B33]